MNDTHSPTIGKIATALVEVQKAMGPAMKTAIGQVGNQKRPYADLASVMEACADPLTENGIAVLQLPMQCADGVLLQTTLVHTSGEWIADGGLHVPAAKKDPQAFGSALTYARRYALAAVLGIVQADDDAKAAMKPAADKPKLEQEQFDELVAKLVESGMSQKVAEGRARACPPDQFAGWLERAQVLVDERAQGAA